MLSPPPPTIDVNRAPDLMPPQANAAPPQPAAQPIDQLIKSLADIRAKKAELQRYWYEKALQFPAPSPTPSNRMIVR